MKTSVASFKP